MRFAIPPITDDAYLYGKKYKNKEKKKKKITRINNLTNKHKYTRGDDAVHGYNTFGVTLIVFIALNGFFFFLFFLFVSTRVVNVPDRIK